jgi:hypothetical protein
MVKTDPSAQDKNQVLTNKQQIYENLFVKEEL